MKALVGLGIILLSASGLFAEGLREVPPPAHPQFTILSGVGPPELDGSFVDDAASRRIHQALFENLLSYDPVTGNGVPGVAESWSVSEDGLTYTFRLRPTAWNDGTPITAQTVVDSWRRTLNPATGSPHAWMVGMVVKGGNEYAYGDGEVANEVVQIRALDELTFQMDLVRPTPYLLNMLPHSAFGLLPLHVIELHGDHWTLPGNIATNGPFMLAERSSNVMTLEKSDEYWDASSVRLEQVAFVTARDDDERYEKYLSGEADWLSGGIPPVRLPIARLREDFVSHPQLATYYFEMNQTRAPLDDARVRRALSLSIDRRAIVEEVSAKGQVPATRITPPLAGYSPPEVVGEDPVLATQLLAEAGYPDGEGFPVLTLLYNESGGHRRIVEYLRATWAERLGIVVRAEAASWSSILDSAGKLEFDLLRMGWVGDYQDPNTFLELFATRSGGGFGRFSHSEFDRLLDLAGALPAGEERYELLRQAEEILIEEQAIIPIYHYVNVDMIDTGKWGGWYPNTLGNHPLKHIHLK